MEPEFAVVAVAVGLPFVAAAVTPLLSRLIGEAVGHVGAGVAAVSFLLLLTLVGVETTVTVPWIPSLGIAFRFRVDGLALLFALLASGIGVLIFAYSTGYMHGEPNLGRFYMALLAFMGSILGVALASDLVLLFVFWELTSVSSFVLIGYHTDDEDSRYSARMALVITVGGGLCLLVALLLVAAAASAAGIGGSGYDLAAILGEPAAVRSALEAGGLFVPALVLLTVAAAAKSAQVPLYFWLPRAMVAPTPVSAFLHSATMVKVGVYALGRFRPLFEGPEWLLLVASLGMLTMAVGAVLAVLAGDVKELLAYSTVSHLGLMVAGFGFLTHYGPEAGVFHLLNHALFKAALFLVAGIVVHQVGVRRVDDLGGLAPDLPATAAIAGIATLAMAGIPPFNGFYSKELLFEAAWATATALGGLAWLFPAVAVLASVFTVLYSLRFLWMFLGDRPADLEVVARPRPALLAPPALLVGVAAAIGVAPGLATGFIVNDGVRATTLAPADVHVGLPTSVTGPVLMSAVAIAGGVALFPVSPAVRRRLEAIMAVTERLHPTALYDGFLAASIRTSSAVSGTVHDGRLRTALWWVLLATCAMVAVGHGTAALGHLAPLTDATPLAMTLVLAAAVLAAVAVVTADSHVTGVLTLGILGFMVAIFYILASGPDLALTQLIVETLLLLIFLLVLEELPAFYGEVERRLALRDAALSIAVGATAFLSTLLAAPAGDVPLSETARFYVDTAVPGGGGTNVVNVILTDFRAFDTLGEAVVIALAAVAVVVLLEMRTRGEQR